MLAKEPAIVPLLHVYQQHSTSDLTLRLRHVYRMITNIPITPHLRRHFLQLLQASRDRLFLLRRAILLPPSTAVNTSHPSTSLTLLPLLETFSVEVLSAGGFAPDEVFGGRHGEDADGTVGVGVDGLAGAVVLFFEGWGGGGAGGGGGRSTGNGCGGED